LDRYKTTVNKLITGFFELLSGTYGYQFFPRQFLPDNFAQKQFFHESISSRKILLQAIRIPKKFFLGQSFPEQFFSGGEKLTKEELVEKEFSEVSLSNSVSFISQLKHRSAHKLSKFFLQCLPFILNLVTEMMDI
jgi:hypothetical protein